jgi:methylenetetrahydrofolate dehydrogenase (NADP+) / methenyltetrahydrofolate cyclohydrolase
MAALLKGGPASKALTEELSIEAAALKEKGITPCLAIVRVGARDDDIAYENGAMKRCEKIGISVKQVLLPEDVTENALLSEIEALNKDASVHGVLLFRPLPKHLNDERVRNALLPEKDMDGITDGSMAAVYAGTDAGYPPCTAAAVIRLLKHYNIELSGKNVTVIGRSLVIGKPVSMLLLKENATVTICHSRTENLAEVSKKADVLVVAMGKAQMITKEYIREGQTVIDVGIHVDADGNMCGDTLFSELEPIVDAITPVPGGVGSVTTAILASHVIEAAKKKIEK